MRSVTNAGSLLFGEMEPVGRMGLTTSRELAKVKPTPEREPLTAEELSWKPLLLQFCDDVWRPSPSQREWFEYQLCKYGIVSVPEQLFLAAWQVRDPFTQSFCTLHPQYHIGNHFTDFMVNPLEHFEHDPLFRKDLLTEFVTEGIHRYAIEIDSKTHHDLTHEKIEEGRIRARQVQRQGFTVIRFAAREVNRDPRPCVTEMCNLLIEDIRTVYSRLRPRQEV